MTRICLVEDHTLFREGLIRTLAAEADLEVVGEAGTPDEAAAMIARLSPDLVLLDMSLPGGDGVHVAAAIRREHPATRVVFLTMHDDELSIRRAMAAGCDGFVPKTATSEELLHAVRVVAGGNAYLSPSVARRVMGNAGPAPKLSDRDLELLQLLGEGLRPAQVAQRMFLSPRTVKNYCSRIYGTLGVGTATQAVAEAYRRGILAPPRH